MKERPPNLRRTQDEQPHQRDIYDPTYLAGSYVHLTSLNNLRFDPGQRQSSLSSKFF